MSRKGWGIGGSPLLPPTPTPLERKREIADGLRESILRMRPGDKLTIEARDGKGSEPLYVITTSTTRADVLG